MRQGNQVYYLHGDHLGSTSLTTNQSGAKIAEARYLPYGEDREIDNSTLPTDFGFTSQRNEAGFGLMDYNARYYSPYLGRFVSPDIIVPSPANSQSFNRYSYVMNNPLAYTDPSGHCRRETSEDGSSQFVYAEDCTVDEFAQLSWDDRVTWASTFVSQHGQGNWFDDIIGAVGFLANDQDFANYQGWASYMDAGVLQAMQNGWRASDLGGNQSVICDVSCGDAQAAADGWAKFFDNKARLENGSPQQLDELIQYRLEGEQGGVNYARGLAESQGRYQTSASDIQNKIDMFLTGADGYRWLAPRVRTVLAVTTLVWRPEWTDPRTSWSTLSKLGPLAEPGAKYFATQYNEYYYGGGVRSR